MTYCPTRGESRLATGVLLLLIQTGLFILVVGLLVAALLVDRSGVHGRDYVVFEARAVQSQQLTVAAFILVIVEFLIGTPLLGAVLAGWRLPALRRGFAARRTANLERLRAIVQPAPLARRA